MGFDLSHPVLQCFKGGSVIDCVDHDDSHCSLIVGLSYGFEAFLSCSVPDLQSYLFAIYFDGFYFEVNSDGRQMRCHEVIFAESEKNVSFSHSTVTNNQQFGQVVIILIPFHCQLSIYYKNELLKKLTYPSLFKEINHKDKHYFIHFMLMKCIFLKACL